jgi:hypothetical protein
MNWKGILGIAASCLVAGLVIGLVIGMRGCGGGANKLLQENAELKSEVTRQRFLASRAEDLRAQHAERRNNAERALAAAKAKEAKSAGTIKDLRIKVARAGRKRDERNDLIDALEGQNAVKNEQVDMLQAALDIAAEEMDAEFLAHSHTKTALGVSEKRANKLERYVVKEKPKRILIGIGSAVGASLVTLGAVAVAR